MLFHWDYAETTIIIIIIIIKMRNIILLLYISCQEESFQLDC